MNPSLPWHEDTELWETIALVDYDEERWRRASPEIDRIIALASLRNPSHILDLCCGPGRHSLELARRGFRVTGVDRMDGFLRSARDRAAQEGLKINFILGDMRSFCSSDTFDAVINLFTSFGYFETPEEDEQVLVNVHRSLTVGGALILDTVGREISRRDFQKQTRDERKGLIYTEEKEVSQDWSWVNHRCFLQIGNVKKEFQYSLRLYSAESMTALLNKTGFRSVNLYGNLAGHPYDGTARRLVAVARK